MEEPNNIGAVNAVYFCRQLQHNFANHPKLDSDESSINTRIQNGSPLMKPNINHLTPNFTLQLW